MIETLMSMSRPAIRSLMRPSWGRRFSAMSSFAIIFTRDTSASCMSFGGVSIFLSAPSTLILTSSSFSYGSTWMSLALSFTACCRSAFKSLMMGASSVSSSMSRGFSNSVATEEKSSPDMRSITSSAVPILP